MRQALASSLAPKRGRIPLANHCRANSALPPHPQSYDELHIHPKTAAGVVGERQRAMQTDVCVCYVGVLQVWTYTEAYWSVKFAFSKWYHNFCCVCKHMECEICVTDSSMCLSFSFRLQWLRGHHKSRSDGNARRKFCRFHFSSHTPLHAHWLSLSCADSCVKSLSCSCFFQHARIYLFVEKEGTPSVSQDGGRRWEYEMHSMYYNSGHYLQWWKPTDSKEFL